MVGRDREAFEYVLLGFLMERPAHGYELAAHFESGGDLAEVGRVGRSQLYSLLNGLERQGAAMSVLQVEESGGPARKVFSATVLGRERFQEWVNRPVGSLRRLRLEFVFKLYFHRRRSPSGEEALLAAQAALLERRLGELGATGTQGGAIEAHLRGLRRCLLVGALEWLAEERSFLTRAAAGQPEGAAP